MNNSEHPLAEIFNSAPATAIPNIGTKAYTLLKYLADGKQHKRSDLIKHPMLGESLRSAVQSLREDKLNNWLIHSVSIANSKVTTLQLDYRHLTSDPKLDAEARAERKRQYKKKSYDEAKQGRKREPKAYTEMTEAQAEYFKSLGNAANDEQ